MSHWLWTCHERGRDCAASAIGYGLGQILGFTKMHWLWTMNKLWVAQEDFLIFIMLPIESLGQGQSIIFVFDHLCVFLGKLWICSTMHITEFMLSEISGSHHSDYENIWNIWNKSLSMPRVPKFVKNTITDTFSSCNALFVIYPWK